MVDLIIARKEEGADDEQSSSNGRGHSNTTSRRLFSFAADAALLTGHEAGDRLDQGKVVCRLRRPHPAAVRHDKLAAVRNDLDGLEDDLAFFSEAADVGVGCGGIGGVVEEPCPVASPVPATGEAGLVHNFVDGAAVDAADLKQCPRSISILQIWSNFRPSRVI
jgi:hypothetical protein